MTKEKLTLPVPKTKKTMVPVPDQWNPAAFLKKQEQPIVLRHPSNYEEWQGRLIDEIDSQAKPLYREYTNLCQTKKHRSNKGRSIRNQLSYLAKTKIAIAQGFFPLPAFAFESLAQTIETMPVDALKSVVAGKEAAIFDKIAVVTGRVPVETSPGKIEWLDQKGKKQRRRDPIVVGVIERPSWNPYDRHWVHKHTYCYGWSLHRQNRHSMEYYYPDEWDAPHSDLYFLAAWR